MRIVPPVTYQGGKSRIAGKILDVIQPEPGNPFWDMCCGSGCISIELVNRGFDPNSIVMVDKGPWGYFWKEIGDGSFNVSEFSRFLSAIPSDPREIPLFMKRLTDESYSSYAFLVLQAASFGGKAVWHDGTRFRHSGFRSYWTPTATSSRRSPVNPMMPMPDTLLQRVRMVSETMRGVVGICGDINDQIPTPNAVVYIDPPYDNTTSYGHECDAAGYAARCGTRCFVSEGKPLTENSVLIASAGARRKGGVSGNRMVANEEWLSVFTPSAG